MKKLAMDIIEKNERGILAKAELEKMMGCKLEDMTDEQKTVGLACLIAFESRWNNASCKKCKWNGRHQKCTCCGRNIHIKDCFEE